MTPDSRTWRPTPEALARARAVAERELSPEEFAAGLRIPLTEAEIEATAELVRWFTTRYPTPGERLAYVRRACRRWMAHSPRPE